MRRQQLVWKIFMAYTPKKGDIVHLEFDPSAGTEMSGAHYALVLSAQDFNKLGLALLCPISQGESSQARSHGFLVSLTGTGTKTNGSVFCHQVRSLDWKARRAKKIEEVPHYIVEECIARIETILS